MQKNLHGQLGKQLVIKHYGSVTVVTKYPDMSRVKRSVARKWNNKRFKDLRNPEERAAYAKELKGRRSVYHAAIEAFMGTPANPD